ncbi:peptide ABC transporter ATP-binding protein [Actinoplanes sp. SE50]|uniref:ABC transporter ATP-binding protein n=1 Tax=unclassified Actinoplanes TaxID=2626549 RepID=UPI00023EC758|nr:MULTISPECIES: ABC transporter ATP-binding protein [unclassified Actinoplanes]AEV83087.1 Glutathione import ATP-binding protein gsiA [Actinoplanes sp. SE50/110]ATO81483.1 peptide ABC transporter ATP-binding protein [Actinoplanes sp. SE50]SLL98890.1 ABC-type peptide/nickel transporter, ATPase component [Actinoplanes sp. SE50/110]
MTDAIVTRYPSPAGGSGAGAVEPLLRVDDLSVTFRSPAGPVTAVRGISYDVRPGEVLGIVGESGSGKSVSSLAVMGLLPDTATITGSATFEGQQLLGLGDKQLSRVRGRRLSMVFQDPLSALTPVYTVGDQIAETIRIHQDIKREAAAERAIELLDLVGIPNPRQRSKGFPHEFSGGMRQRVMIAMAIANDPALIIADEPTTALDVTIQAQILEVLQTAREATGAAIVMITHDLGVVAGFADRMLVMYAGRVVETGQVETVYQRPRMPYTMGLLGSIPRLDMGERQRLTPIDGVPPSMVDLPAGCPFAPRCPMKIQVCEETEPELLGVVIDGAGHLAACHRSPEIARKELTNVDVFPTTVVPEATGPARLPREQRPVVLEVNELVKEYPITKGGVLRRKVGSLQAVAGISFDIREGETLGLVGESGCGKTTTIMEILELAKPTSGTIAVLGKDTAAMSRKERFAIRRDLQVVFQDPLASLDPRLPVSDILAEPMATHGVPAAEREKRVRELLRLVGLRPEHADRYPAKFSGGQRQRIGIARALALEPKVLVLDEPVSALDVSIQAGVINLLEQLKVELGLSYLFVAHDLSVVRHIADRVAVMYLGRIVEIGTANQVFEAPEHPYTQALLSAIPLPDPVKERSRRRILLTGDLPSPANPPSGCRFRTRCPKFANELDDAQRQRCLDESPALTVRDTVVPDHESACHYAAPVKAI